MKTAGNFFVVNFFSFFWGMGVDPIDMGMNLTIHATEKSTRKRKGEHPRIEHWIVG